MTSLMSMRSVANIRVSDKPWIAQSLKSSILINDRSYFINMRKTMKLTNIGVVNYKDMLNLLAKVSKWWKEDKYLGGLTLSLTSLWSISYCLT